MLAAKSQVPCGVYQITDLCFPEPRGSAWPSQMRRAAVSVSCEYRRRMRPGGNREFSAIPSNRYRVLLLNFRVHLLVTVFLRMTVDTYSEDQADLEDCATRAGGNSRRTRRPLSSSVQSWIADDGRDLTRLDPGLASTHLALPSHHALTEFRLGQSALPHWPHKRDIPMLLLGQVFTFGSQHF